MSKNTNLSFLTDYITADITNGRIGINTPSPTVAFDVTGVAKFSSSVGVGGTATGTYGTLSVFGGISTKNDNNGKLEIGRYSSGVPNSYIKLGANSDSLRITNNTDAADLVTITNAGNVGIGTSSPSFALDVASTSADSFRINRTGVAGTGSASSMSFQVTQSNGQSATLGSISGEFMSNWGGDLRFYTKPANGTPNDSVTERMRITSGGNVGIGTTSPSVLLHAKTTGDGYNMLTIEATSGDAGIALKGGTGGTSVGGFTIQGQNGGSMVFVDRNSTPATRMTISSNGSIGAPSGTNIYNASDARLKKNVSTTTYGLDTISALNPVKFNWVDGFEPSEDGKDMLGFIAQEVQSILPEAVETFGGNSLILGDTTIDNPLRVNEKFIIPVLVKAIQELKAEIETLKNK